MNTYQPILISLLLAWFSSAQAVPKQGRSLPQDSSKVIQLNQEFERAIQQKNYTKAMKLGKDALTLSDKYLLNKQKVKALLLFGKLHIKTDEAAIALSYYLQAESTCLSYDLSGSLSVVYYDLGLFYQKYNLYKKAIQYFKKSYDLRKGEGYSQALISTLEHMAFCYYALKNYVTSGVFYEKLWGIYRSKKNTSQVIKTLEKLVNINSLSKKYKKAIAYNTRLINLHKKQGNLTKLSSVYNNLGFLYQRVKDTEQAINYFRLSSEVIQQKKLDINKPELMTLLVNTGVAYTNLVSFSRARKQFEQAAQLSTKNSIGQAEIHNYAGANYYLSGNNTAALVEVERAIDIARPKQAWNVLLVSYDLLARIYQQEQNNKKAKEYNVRRLAALRKIKEKERKQSQQMDYDQTLMEQQERRIKQALAQQKQLSALKNIREKQAKNLALKNNQLKLKQNELALLKKAKELDVANFQKAQLDRVRQEQALLLAEGKLREAKLESEKTKTAFALEREKVARRLRAERSKRKLRELIQQRKIQQQEIQKQKIKEKYGIGIIALAGLILSLVFWLWINTRRSRQRERKQKEEIEEKSQEISAQNDFLHYKQQEIVDAYTLLEEKNTHISQSIKAAQTIQEAILPNPKKLQELLPTHFVFYQPKDIVSGDFYWLEKSGAKTVLIASDCTGHGVPGAFMSMIGNTLFNRIIQLQGILEPQRILTILNQEIVQVLQQKEEGYRNGMDVALVIWEQQDNEFHLTFAGAKRPLYFLKTDGTSVQRIKGDRHSIGSENPVFTQQTLTLQKGDSIYLSSDGFEDQNNVKRKKIGRKKFEELLIILREQPMEQRKLAFEEFLKTHMEGTAQRDDILLVGVEF